MTIDDRLDPADDSVVGPACGMTSSPSKFAAGLAFAAALEVMPAHVTVIDANGTILYVNDAWRRYGSDNALQSSNCCVGQNYLAVCDTAIGDSSAQAADAAEGIRAVLQGTASKFVINYPCHAPNEPRWFRLLVAPMHEDHIVGAVIMHVDITGPEQDAEALRTAERVTRESEQRLNEAQRIARIGDWSWDISTNQVIWSAQVFEIMGLDPRAPTPSYPDELATYYDAASFVILQQHVAAAIASGEPQEYELVVMRADGERRFTQAIALPRKDTAGNVIALYGTVQDITERKQAELESERLASIVASSDDAIIGKNLSSIITSWNRGAQKIFGFTAEEMVGASIRRIIPLDRQAEEDHIITNVSRGDSVEHFETIRVTKDGRLIDVSVTASPIRDASDAVIGLSTVARDISERKKLEQQFLRAQRMESIGTLAGGIAHDLNNVLGPIMLSLELLKMSFPDEASQELIGIIEGSARHGSEMVRQVLSFARGVEGQRLNIDVADLVHDIEKITKDTFLKHITVRTSVPPDRWSVIGDPTQLHQVLLNLCVNARDAMPGGGQLIITAENVTIDAHYADVNLDAKAGPFVVFRVEDSGAGIRPDILDRIFDPFFTTKEVGKGTGLGLSTSMAIVKSHGGFIRAYSEIGRGSKFNVYIPARAAATKDVGVPVTELPRGRGELVLVVDDEPAVRQITQQTLEAFGYRVLVAVDGADAVAVYARRSDDIAVVLTDMMMPVMDGPSTIRVLRKMNPAVRIIAASGLDANAHGVGLGISHFLPKPYAADRLLTTLRAAINDGA